MAAAVASTSARNEFFKQLKPCCVSISRLAIKTPVNLADARKLTELTEELFGLLSTQVNRDSSAMDDKLADYVFFPLSHIFRNQEHHSTRLLELAIKCLTVLLFHGWKAKLSDELMRQLLILLTFIARGVPGQGVKRDLPEETELEALRALTALITVAGLSITAAAAIVDVESIPTLGHTVTIALELIANGRTPEIQLEALRVVQAIYTSIKETEALATFLPGVVSCLVRVLSKPAGEKVRVLVASVINLTLVIVKVLGDMRTRSILHKRATESSKQEEEGKILTPAWLQATTSQIKLALATVLKLRTHNSADVRTSLERMSVVLLDECHLSLENCTSILVETAIMLGSTDGNSETTQTGLQDLAIIYPELGEVIKTTVYNWIVGLASTMNSSDERKKQSAIQGLQSGLAIVTALKLDSSTLDDSIAAALRDSTLSLVAATQQEKLVGEMSGEASLWFDRDLVKSIGYLREYRPVLINRESQMTTRTHMLGLISNIGSVSQQTKLAAEMLDYAKEVDSTSQVTSLWLSLELIKASFAHSNEVDSFLDFSAFTPASEDSEAILHDIYSFAVTVLDSHSDIYETDWRLEAIALEATAFAASRSGVAFRPELIDILYPIATFLGSPNTELRNHAITTLNILAKACEYRSVSELIIENVDYMVNSVSLGLNTFDISPASTKVLIMMTRLTGPRLIPYLDDIVASIFAALDNYHGYTALVESLFAVLREVVDQGVKSDKLLLGRSGNAPRSHKKVLPKPVTIEVIAQQLRRRADAQRRLKEEEGEETSGGHPTIPWASMRRQGSVEAANIHGGADEGTPNAEMNKEKEKPPKTPTYILLEKIAAHTQHYLTSPTPTLRKSLLELLATVSPALSEDEDSFLPLVNTVWPVIISRLYDPEPFVTVAASEALCALCSTAGDFLSSRIKTEWPTTLGKWCRSKKKAARQSRGASDATRMPGAMSESPIVPSRDILLPLRTGNDLEGKSSSELVPSSAAAMGGWGKFAQSVQIWNAVIRFLTAIVMNVRIGSETFDEILALLVDELDQNQDVRAALEVVNSDAVWLALYRKGRVDIRPTPQLAGVTFAPMERFG